MAQASRTFILVHDQARAGAKRAIDDPACAGWRVRISPPAKSREQEERYHAMIGDISKQCTFLDRKWSLEDWKRLLVDAFVDEIRAVAKAAGSPDPFADQGHVTPSLDGRRIVQLGIQTRKFSKKIATEFIEFLFAYGAENSVQWSEASKAAYQEMRRAA